MVFFHEPSGRVQPIIILDHQGNETEEVTCSVCKGNKYPTRFANTVFFACDCIRPVIRNLDKYTKEEG